MFFFLMNPERRSRQAIICKVRLNSPGLQPGDYKIPKYISAASKAMLMGMPCLQRETWGMAIDYHRLKPAAIEKDNYCIPFIVPGL